MGIRYQTHLLSSMYSIPYTLNVNVRIDIFKLLFRCLAVELKTWLISACLSFVSQKNKNKSAIRGVQLLPIGVLTL